MSTHFTGDGNIGSAPEFRVFPNGNEEPRKLLRINVRFDNPIPIKGGGYEDRGGFWAPVEIWHSDAEHWSKLYQKGMRVMVEGRMISQEWEDKEGVKQVTFKIEARRIGILPQRIKAVVMMGVSEDLTGEDDVDGVNDESGEDMSEDAGKPVKGKKEGRTSK